MLLLPTNLHIVRMLTMSLYYIITHMSMSPLATIASSDARVDTYSNRDPDDDKK